MANSDGKQRHRGRFGVAWCCAIEGQPGSTLVRLASPSMFMVPRKLVFMVLMGLYLQQHCQ